MDFKVCYIQWKEFFDQDVFKVWKEEATPNLKNLSMLMFCFDRELENLQKSTRNKVTTLRKVLNSSDSTLLEGDKSEVHKDDSAEIISINSTPSLECSSGQSDRTVSNNDILESSVKVSTSPEIKKTHKLTHHKRKKKLLQPKLEDSATPSDSIIRKLKENLQINKEHNGNKERSSEWSFQIFHSLKDDKQPKLLLANSPAPLQEQVKSDDDVDTSIIQGTPILKLKNQSKSFLKVHQKSKLSKRLAHPSKSHTLAKKLCERTEETSNNTDFINKENTSNMYVTDMINYLNEDGSCASNISLNSGMLEDDFNLSEENSTSNHTPVKPNADGDKLDRSLNSFLAEAQNVPRQTEAAPKVLGKQRQKLPGWACKVCENLYLHSDLNEKQILQLAKCSKHRGYYKPREETLPGYWDMNVLTPDA